MTAISAKRKRFNYIALAFGVVGAIAVPTSIVVSTNSLLNTKDGNEIETSDIMKIPPTPGAMMALTNAAGELTSINVFALAPGGEGGTIFNVPVGALADISDTNVARRVGDAFASGGMDSLVTEVEGLLDVTFSVTKQMNATKFAEFIAPLAPASVSLTRPVTDATLSGEAVVIPAGETDATAEQMALLLTATRADQPESVRFERSLALWTGIAKKVGDGIKPSEDLEPLDYTGAPTTFPGFFERLISGPIQTWQFTASLITEPARNPQALDVYEIESAEIITVVASVMPSAATSASTGLTFEIDSPFADPEIIKSAVAIVTFWGGSVILVREIPGPAKVETRALYSDSIIKRDINGFQPVVGPIELTRSENNRVEGIDVRLTLGQNFVDFQADPSKFGETQTTTTTAGSTTTP